MDIATLLTTLYFKDGKEATLVAEFVSLAKALKLNEERLGDLLRERFVKEVKNE